MRGVDLLHFRKELQDDCNDIINERTSGKSSVTSQLETASAKLGAGERQQLTHSPEEALKKVKETIAEVSKIRDESKTVKRGIK